MDGQYVPDSKGGIHTVNLAEKLLVPLLAKFSNFIPGAAMGKLGLKAGGKALKIKIKFEKKSYM